MAFGPDGSRFALVSSAGTAFLLRAAPTDDRFEMVRRVANNLWWFDIAVHEDGSWKAVFHDDSGGPRKRKVYDLGSESRASSTKLAVVSPHYFTTSLPASSGIYALAERVVFRYQEGQWLSLDQEAVATPDERAAHFFISGDKGIHHRTLADGPDRWQLLCSSKQRAKQIAHDSKNKLIVRAGRWPASLFVDRKGKTSSHEREGGLWSVCVYQGRKFFYSFAEGVVEVSEKGKELVHGVNGEIARNQCLFASSQALYFVSVGESGKKLFGDVDCCGGGDVASSVLGFL